jgi:hypothetical protein
MVATAQRVKGKGKVNQPLGEDGEPVRLWIDPDTGDVVPLSLRPYAESERVIYWNPNGGGSPGQVMHIRGHELDERGEPRPVTQREIWHEGKFSPRNEWETYVTEAWMRRSLEGGTDPKRWTGNNHPDGPGYGWRCECAWFCENWQCFSQHQLTMGHTKMRSEAIR